MNLLFGWVFKKKRYDEEEGATTAQKNGSVLYGGVTYATTLQATSIENENTGHTIKIVKTAYQSCLHENKQKPFRYKNFRSSRVALFIRHV